MKTLTPNVVKISLILLFAGILFYVIDNKPMNAESSDKPKIKQVIDLETHTSDEPVDWQSKGDDYWKERMTPEQFHVSRKAGTEMPFSGQYYKDKREGAYLCSSCGLELFASDTKYDSGTGWPSFTDPVNTKNVRLIVDNSKGMKRTEVVCARCNAHLGHVFDDGPSESGNRFCINSLSLIHEKDKE